MFVGVCRVPVDACTVKHPPPFSFLPEAFISAFNIVQTTPQARLSREIPTANNAQVKGFLTVVFFEIYFALPNANHIYSNDKLLLLSAV